MKKILILAMLVFTASAALADKMPADLKSAYDRLNQSVKKLDAMVFEGFFAPEFVSVDPKGKTEKREPFLKSLRPLFSGSTSASMSEKFSSVKLKGDKADVSFDMHATFTGKSARTRFVK